jgi:DNA-binding response OmpR family regulator
MAVTARASAEDRVWALASGFQMHIAEPIDPEEMIAVVASLVGRIHIELTRLTRGFKPALSTLSPRGRNEKALDEAPRP